MRAERGEREEIAYMTEKIEVKDVQVNVEDVDMVAEQIIGKVIMETEDVL